MMPKRRNKLYFVLFVFLLSASIAALLIFALNENMNLFFTPTQIAKKEAPLNTRIKVGGMVKKNSLLRKENLALEFEITDFKETLTILYKGILPDLFREGQGVVALGFLRGSNIFVADELLAKHDENYMPYELTELSKEEKP